MQRLEVLEPLVNLDQEVWPRSLDVLIAQLD